MKTTNLRIKLSNDSYFHNVNDIQSVYAGDRQPHQQCYTDKSCRQLHGGEKTG